MLTTKQVAEALNVSTTRVRILAGQGRLGARKFGDVWTLDPEAVEEYKRTRKAGRPWKGKA